MKKTKNLVETGIKNMMIIPDPNKTILYFKGAKWYSWMFIIQLDDRERDQLAEVLQKLKSDKEGRYTEVKEVACDEPGTHSEEGKMKIDKFDGTMVIKLAQERAGDNGSVSYEEKRDR